MGTAPQAACMEHWRLSPAHRVCAASRNEPEGSFPPLPVCTMEVSGLRGLLWQGCVLPRSGNQASAQGDGPARSPCFHRNSRWPYRLLISSQPLLPFAEAPSRDAEDDGLSQHRQPTHSEDARKANLQCHRQWNPSALGAHNSLEGQHAAQGTQRASLMKTQ